MPKISVLIPSRKRAELLKDSIKGWVHKDVELLVAIDEDDDIEPYEEISSIVIYVTKRYGYENLHEYYNFLAKKAKGDWLMVGNDDGYMLTKDWPYKITQDPSYPQVLNVWNEQDNLFPLISRAWYEATGHFAPNTHIDSWVQQTAELIGNTTYIPGINMKHLGEDLNDETHREVRSVVGQSSEAYRRMTEERKEDARKINEYIEKRGLKNARNN